MIAMVLPWSRTLANMYRVGRQKKSEVARDVYGFWFQSISRVPSFEMPIAPGSTRKSYAAKSEGQALEQLVKLNKMFRTNPRSLALPPGSPKRINEPNYEGIRRFILRLMLFYSKQSTSIRSANVIYRRVISQVDKSSVYDG